MEPLDGDCFSPPADHAPKIKAGTARNKAIPAR
jgi:hypothetical protein